MPAIRTESDGAHTIVFLSLYSIHHHEPFVTVSGSVGKMPAIRAEGEIPHKIILLTLLAIYYQQRGWDENGQPDLKKITKQFAEKL